MYSMRKPYENDQADLIEWLSQNGLRIDEGVPHRERLYIDKNVLHLELYGEDLHTGELVAVPGTMKVTVMPPAELGIRRKDS